MTKPLTPREQALAGYVYAVLATDDPRVKAAGLSPLKFGQAVLACVKDDLTNVTAFVLSSAVGPKAASAAKNIVATGLGGVISEKARGDAATVVETLIQDGFNWLGDKIAGPPTKKR